MSATAKKGVAPPRIERLKVRNFRALRDVELTNLTPLSGLLGPNGSGKSTVFDVFAFLAECFESGLRRAWEKRGRARELKSRGVEGPVLIEIAYREQPRRPLITYHLEVDEVNGRPVVKGGVAPMEAGAVWSALQVSRLRERSRTGHLGRTARRTGRAD